MFNNPMMYGSSYMRPGLLSGLRMINWRGLLSNTRETLGIINQTIPIIYQVRPMLNNAKTMLRVASTIRSDDSSNNSTNNNNNNYSVSDQNKNTDIYDNKPVFYI